MKDIVIELSVISLPDVEFVPFLYAAWDEATAPPTGVKFIESTFKTFSDYRQYFDRALPLIKGFSIYIDDIQNIPCTNIIERSINLEGKIYTTIHPLKVYATAIGNGYDKTIVFPADTYTFNYSPTRQLLFSRLRGKSYVKVTFHI